MSWFKENKNEVIVTVCVIPKSSKNEIIGVHNDLLKVKLKAPPIDNRANNELIELLAKKLNIPKSNLKIISGHKHKRKVLSLLGCKIEQLMGICQIG